MRRILPPITLVLALVTPPPGHASPIVIEFDAIDLADTTAGEDLWEYRYFVTDFDVLADQGFSISFDFTRYTDLQSPAPAVNADWDVATFQPDAVLQSDGLYDALALTGGASLADAFVLSFVWLGAPGTTPGSQPFTVNQFDEDGNLTVIDTGRTVPVGQTPLPEPSTLLLVVTAGAGLARRLRAIGPPRSRPGAVAARPPVAHPGR